MTSPSQNGDILFAFLSIVLEGAPYIVLGTVISGFIDAYLPSNLMDRLLPRRRLLAVLVSGLLGAVFPMCECAIVPVIRRLVRKGLPVSCAITYMLSAPVINPVVVVSTLSAFKGQNAVFMMSSRLAIAYLITVLIGLAVSFFPINAVLRPRVLAEVGDDAGHTHARGNHDVRVRHALRTATTDFLDTALYFVIGVMITSVFNARLMILPQFQANIAAVAHNNWLAVPGLMVLAALLSLCSTTDAFIAATMQAFSWVSKLAFLVFGPMFDLKLMFMYSTVFRRRFVLALALALFTLAGLFCGIWALAAPRLMGN
jgi:uncharacterized protein